MATSVRWRRAALVLLGGAALAVACSRPAPPPTDAGTLAALPWDSIVARARGTHVLWRMWRGDPSINRFVDQWVAPRLAQRYGITLETVSGQGSELVEQLTTERVAGATTGTASLVWINGETFAALRQRDLLYGPWSGRLPAAAWVDSASPIIARDFGQDPAGYESPWGTVQFALIHDTVRTPNPPRTAAELQVWIRAHPGRFTVDRSFAGMTFLKGMLYALNGGSARLAGAFDSVRYLEGRDQLVAWFRDSRGAFWREGTQYPADVAALHRLFANGEIDFTWSNNQNEAVTKVLQGVLPPTSRALILRDASIANAHYLGIPATAPNPAGAMVVANFLLEPEAQLEKQRPSVWADGTVLRWRALPAPWPARFESVAGDPRLVPGDTLARYAQPEVSWQLHARLQDDWRRLVR